MREGSEAVVAVVVAVAVARSRSVIRRAIMVKYNQNCIDADYAYYAEYADDIC